jgi:single-strand DNA-binding protein
MPNLNKVMLMGNLTRDIELRHTASQMAIAKFGLAINRKYKTASGEQKEEVTFVDCDAFGRTAEVMHQYLKKGRPVFVEGSLRLDQWEGKDGSKQSKLKVVVDSFQFIDSGGGTGGGGGSGGAEGGTVQTRSYNSSRAPAASSSQPGPSHEPMNEEDIPF